MATHITSEQARPTAAPVRLMCVATHHKTGTVWIKRVIKAIAQEMDLPWIGVWNDGRMDKVPDMGAAFLCNWAGYFPEALWAREDAAFLHIIRDPRDVLLSGCAYHHSAPVKGEAFLHKARGDLGGATYQEHLNALESQYDKLMFEMENKHAETVSEMRRWPWGDPRVAELRYEDLMQDVEGALMRGALSQLGLAGADLDRGVEIFLANSLFGGLADPSAQGARVRAHVKSGGRIARWKTEMPKAIAVQYAARFGDDLIALGYENDRSWVGQLAD